MQKCLQDMTLQEPIPSKVKSGPCSSFSCLLIHFPPSFFHMPLPPKLPRAPHPCLRWGC